MGGDGSELFVESGGYCIVIGEGFVVKCNGLVGRGSVAFAG